MPSNSTVWVVIPTFNRQQLLRECLYGLFKQSYPNLKIIVVDDGTDKTFKQIQCDFPKVTVLKTSGNKWWTGSMNIGLSFVRPIAKENDFILSFNDDVEIENDFIQNIVNSSLSAGNNSIIGALAVDIKDENKTVFSGTTISWKTGRWGSKKHEVSNNAPLIPTDSLPGRGCLIPIKAFTEIGYYDEHLFPQYFGDEDYVLTAKSKGYSLFVSREAIVKSHVEETGIGRYNQTLTQFMKSLFSIRSPNQLMRRKQFIFKHAPRKYKISFWLIDSAKVITSFFRNKEMRK
ncbi:MAG: glycosyltransferase family 2 protein [Pseudomonadota bacterium]|nr:glycosyltransferase family 2 protein [Pseudomonadota bacterium]